MNLGFMWTFRIFTFLIMQMNINVYNPFDFMCSLVYSQLKVQEALRKKEKFQREHEEVS